MTDTRRPISFEGSIDPETIDPTRLLRLTRTIGELARFVVVPGIDPSIFRPTKEPIRQIAMCAAEGVPGTQKMVCRH